MSRDSDLRRMEKDSVYRNYLRTIFKTHDFKIKNQNKLINEILEKFKDIFNPRASDHTMIAAAAYSVLKKNKYNITSEEIAYMFNCARSSVFTRMIR